MLLKKFTMEITFIQNKHDRTKEELQSNPLLQNCPYILEFRANRPYSATRVKIPLIT